MLGRILRWSAIVVIASMLLPGCANFTKSGRQQLAYARYVKKYSGKRAKAQKKYKKVRMPNPGLSDYTTTTAVGQSPQSVSTGAAQTQP